MTEINVIDDAIARYGRCNDCELIKRVKAHQYGGHQRRALCRECGEW